MSSQHSLIHMMQTMPTFFRSCFWRYQFWSMPVQLSLHAWVMYTHLHPEVRRSGSRTIKCNPCQTKPTSRIGPASSLSQESWNKQILFSNRRKTNKWTRRWTRCVIICYSKLMVKFTFLSAIEPRLSAFVCHQYILIFISKYAQSNKYNSEFKIFYKIL